MALFILLIRASLLLLGSVVVTIGILFGGKDLIVDMSKPERTLIAIVLGIGVAESNN